MTSQADSICYTIINVPTDNESINELSLKTDLGKFGEESAIHTRTPIDLLTKWIYIIIFFLNKKNQLEKGDVKAKTEALKKLIYLILNGEKFPPNMLMTIIRYVLPCSDHEVKKLLLIFWEIVPKRG